MPDPAVPPLDPAVEEMFKKLFGPDEPAEKSKDAQLEAAVAGTVTLGLLALQQALTALVLKRTIRVATGRTVSFRQTWAIYSLIAMAGKIFNGRGETSTERNSTAEKQGKEIAAAAMPLIRDLKKST